MTLRYTATQDELARGKKMRLLILVPSLMRAGAETQAIDLANGLVDRGHAVHLCCFERQLDQRCRIDQRVNFHHLLRRTKYDVSVAGRLARLIDSERIDVILSVLQISTLYAWLALEWSQRKPALAAAIHTTISRDRKQDFFTRVLYRRVLRRAGAIIFVCNHQKNCWLDRFPELHQRARVIYNGVDPARFCRGEFQLKAAILKSELGIPESAFVFSIIAAFRPEKGHDILIDAFARLEGEPYLICAGDGVRRRDIETKARSIGLGKRVCFLGVVEDARPVIAASNATILSSTAVETFSMAMLESMCLGVPVIGPIIGGLPEAIEEGQNGLLFPVGDVDSLAVCMQSLVDDRDRAARMGGLAREAVRSKYTFAGMVSAYESVLGTARGRMK